MAVLLKAVFRFSAISVKLPVAFFTELEFKKILICMKRVLFLQSFVVEGNTGVLQYLEGDINTGNVVFYNEWDWPSLVVHWLRIPLAMQRTPVQFLVWDNLLWGN